MGERMADTGEVPMTHQQTFRGPQPLSGRAAHQPSAKLLGQDAPLEVFFGSHFRAYG
jgi:hypothetical protein